MSPEQERHYLQLAQDQPEMLGREAPPEVLEAASLVDEPTKFLLDFCAAGHVQWLLRKYGREIPYTREEVSDAAVALWVRACILNTSRLLGRADANWDKPFFCDEGLYRQEW